MIIIRLKTKQRVEASIQVVTVSSEGNEEDKDRHSKTSKAARQANTERLITSNSRRQYIPTKITRPTRIR